MEEASRSKLKEMILATSGHAQGYRQGIEDSAKSNPALALALARDPGFLDRSVDDLLDRLVPLYQSMDEATVAAITDFFLRGAGARLVAHQRGVNSTAAEIFKEWAVRTQLKLLSLVAEGRQK